MSVLVVGLSHRSAPVDVLERAVLQGDQIGKALHELAQCDHVDEALVLSTCNRIEVYASVEKFHAGVQQVSEALARVAEPVLDELTPHLYVHYEDRAVQHLFGVACGLDSMVVGEAQILGQLRTAFRTAQAERATGRVLNELVRQALRVGKRAHAETGIDRAGASLVTVGLDLAERTVGSLAAHRALIVGAGSMGSLTGTTLRRRGVARIAVANRTVANGRRLAASLEAATVGLDQLVPAITEADVVVSSTGAVGTVVPYDVVAEAVRARGGRPLFVLDLALPRDVDPAVRGLPGVTLADLESLRSVLESAEAAADVEAVRRIVAEEVARFLSWQRSVQVAPTVAALRGKAAQVVDIELDRLLARVQLDARGRAEVATTLQRVVDKLLHAPTVRVKELADGPGGDKYAEALRELFELDPSAPEAVTRADVALEEDER
ncbi:MAG: glutamyl-tRNA reductase [Frankiaceae bacterium]